MQDRMTNIPSFRRASRLTHVMALSSFTPGFVTPKVEARTIESLPPPPFVDSPCSAQTIIEGERVELLGGSPETGVTIRGYGIQPDARSIRQIIMAYEPGTLPDQPVGISASNINLDLFATVELPEPTLANQNPSAPLFSIGFGFSDDKEEQALNGASSILTGAKIDSCNIVKARVDGLRLNAEFNGSPFISTAPAF